MIFKLQMRKKALKHPSLWSVFACLVVFSLVACGSSSGPGPSSTATVPATPKASPTPFRVTSVDLSVNPNSIAGKPCGSSASFTYTATFHIPTGTAGGTIELLYTLNNGRSSSRASVRVGPGETTKTFTFTSSGTLYPDHTYPGIAQVQVTSPNAVNSPQVKLAGACTETSAFKVTSIGMAVSPQSLAGLSCGTYLTVTYTATFHVAANSLGGMVQFDDTTNNGRSNKGSSSLTFGLGETTKTFTFTWAGNLPADHFYPEPGGVVSTSPNAFPLDSLGSGVYTSPVGRRQESMAFLDPLEGTETNMVSSGTLGPTGQCS